MRTTITIDDDIAVRIERLRSEQGKSLKGVINEALRRGLNDKLCAREARVPYRTKSFNLGRCLLPNLDCVSEALAIAEGENHA